MTHTTHAPKTRSTPDQIALRALAAGHLTVDSANGAIYRTDGQRAEYPRHDGYGFVPLAERGRRTTIGAHRLVWLAVHGPIPPRLLVNHINKRTWDNRPANLELVTRAGNWHHGAGEEYVHIGNTGVDPSWLEHVHDALRGGDLDAETLNALRGDPLSGPVEPYSGGSVVKARNPARSKRRSAW